MAITKHIKEVAKKQKDLYRSEPSYPNKKLILTLGLPQSVNHMYIRTRNGGQTLTKVAIQYIRDSRAMINQAVEDNLWQLEQNATWYYLDMVVHMPDRKIRDSHNMLKLLLDTMQGFAFHDDYYCMPRIQGVEYDSDNPRIDIILRPQTKKDRNQVLTNFCSCCE